MCFVWLHIQYGNSFHKLKKINLLSKKQLIYIIKMLSRIRVQLMEWYVVQTKSRQERRALTNLERQGYPCYLPFRAKKKLRKNLTTVEQEPLFTNYLFIQLDISSTGKSWGPIRSTLGVSRLVSFGLSPLKVEPELIEIIRVFENNLTNSEPAPLFTPGQKVLLTEGPFTGLEAIYHLEDGDARSIVLINLLGKPTKLHVPTGILNKHL